MGRNRTGEEEEEDWEEEMGEVRGRGQIGKGMGEKRRRMRTEDGRGEYSIR